MGIDVGGTNTDAVILDDDNAILARRKTPVTRDVISGIHTAVSTILDDAGVSRAAVTHVMLGTTQVTNAIIERRELSSVATLRFGAPATEAIKPLTGWPDDLRRRVNGASVILPGGFEYDGRPISRFDADGVRRFVRAAKDKVGAFAVTSVFSPVRDDHERYAAEIIAEETAGAMPISLSSQIGSLGLLDRENAAILNAAVSRVAQRVTDAVSKVLTGLEIQADLFLTQNDGTLMSREYALRYPILTIACGPTNSIRGAAVLTALRDAIVIDIGGTSTDVGVLASGFPRESAIAVEIGGVRTNFRMPDLVSIGLGGGSVVRWDADGAVRIGPESVGFQIVEDALCFGGDTLTMTDVAVARGMADLGDPMRITVPEEIIERAHMEATSMIEEAIDRMKTTADDVPIIAVGGGSIILPATLAGASTVYRPSDFDVANAMGAAIAQVSGEIDRIFSLGSRSREDVLNEAREGAIGEARKAGADPTTLEIIELEEVPLTYLPGNAVRVKAKAAGRLMNF